MPNTAVILDKNGNVAIIVHPDREDQLNDPAFNPPQHTHVRLPRAEYDACKHDPTVGDSLDLLKKLEPLVRQKSVSTANKLASKISTLESEKSAKEAAIAADLALYESLTEEEQLVIDSGGDLLL